MHVSLLGVTLWCSDAGGSKQRTIGRVSISVFKYVDIVEHAMICEMPL